MVNGLVIPILQTRKLRIRERKQRSLGCNLMVQNSLFCIQVMEEPSGHRRKDAFAKKQERGLTVFLTLMLIEMSLKKKTNMQIPGSSTASDFKLKLRSTKKKVQENCQIVTNGKRRIVMLCRTTRDLA